MKKKKWIIGIISIALILGIGTTYYFNDYYRVQEDVVVEMADAAIQEVYTQDYIVYEPENTEVGFILYPGAKVQFESYAPLMQKLAKKGILTSVVHMPCNFAIFDIDAAKGIVEKYPKIKKWYIGGHSLGGSMAGTFASENSDLFKGVIFLASYTTSDLSQSGLSVLSIYGSKDGVLNKENMEKNNVNLPKDMVEYVIEGGNHSYFGNYGEQNGDGQATISREEQQEQTVQAILEFVGVGE